MTAAIGLIGVSIGAAVGGILGDRYGRRPCLIASIILFGTVTAATCAIGGISGLTVLRMLAGIGLGSTIPNATALIAEYTPSRYRSLALGLGMVCMPLGSLASGVIASAVLPVYGWRTFFLLGGILPIILGILMVRILPESPRFLLRHRQQSDELKRAFKSMGLELDLAALPRDASSVRKPRAGFSDLFGGPLSRNTLALWTSFFFCMLALYTVFSWGPAMLAGQGFDLAATSLALAVFNAGGIAGSLASAGLIYWLGSYRAALAVGSFAVLGAATLAVLPINAAAGLVPLLVAFSLESFFLAGFQNVLYPIAANVYPSDTRATGIGAAAALGRVGAVTSSFTGIATLDFGGVHAYFAFLAVAMLAATISVVCVTRHIAPER